MTSTTETLTLPDVDLVYDVHGPIPSADGRPLLFMIGQPMQADGFTDLAAQFPDRTVVTYDPHGLGQSTLDDPSLPVTPEVEADDLACLVDAVGGGQHHAQAGTDGCMVIGDEHPDLLQGSSPLLLDRSGTRHRARRATMP